MYVGADHTGPVPLHLKVAAALTTGAVAISIASPTDLVKVRLQSEGKLPPGAARRYPSAVQAYGIIARQEGVRALWTGLGPNVVRNSVMNAAELASYDQIKESLLATGLFVDDVKCHIASGLGAGFVATCIGSPGTDRRAVRAARSPGRRPRGGIGRYRRAVHLLTISACAHAARPPHAEQWTW